MTGSFTIPSILMRGHNYGILEPHHLLLATLLTNDQKTIIEAAEQLRILPKSALGIATFLVKRRVLKKGKLPGTYKLDPGYVNYVR